MKKLSKQKRLQLVFVGIITVGVVAALWMLVITAQKQKLADIAKKSENVQNEIAKIQKVSLEVDQVQTNLAEVTNKLNEIESTMPSSSGDLFAWIVTTLKQFNSPSYKVEMPQISAPAVGAMKMLPQFPYNQALVTVSGTGYYYDIGKFIADFENHFPHMRVENLNLEPGFATVSANAEEREKLNFRMEIVTLVKPAGH